MLLLIQDIRYALRGLRANFGLTAAVVVSLAIGIGANTAIFSVVNALLLRPLPYPEPSRLAILWLRSPGIGILQDWPSPGQYIDIKTQNHSFQEMSISIGASMTLTGRDQPERVEALRTSSSLFHMLGAKPLLGRLLLPEEDKPGSPPVAVLTHAVWQRLFNSNPQIIGKSVVLNGNPFTVVGVLRPEFMLNQEIMPTVGAITSMEVFLPLPLGADAVNRRGDENYNLLARLNPGATMAQAQSDIKVIADRIREKDKRDRTYTISVVPLLEQVVGDVRPALLVLLGSVALVLLIACANVANLLLSRAARRQKEVAIRTALGAGWQRLLAQLLTESMLLGIAGGAAGLLIAEWSLHVARVMHPGNIPRMGEIGIDGRVLAFTFVISIITGIVFGIAPALQAAKVDLNTALKVGGRSSQGDGGLNTSQHRLRGLLVISEVALSVMLLIAAGLLLRSFARLQAVSPGFNPDRVMSMMVQVSGPAYRPQAARVQFFQAVRERIASLPGVKVAGGVTTLPFAPGLGWGSINVEGFTPPPGQELQVDQRIASVGYFRTMEIPLRQGRFFEDRDKPDSPPVVLIDEKFAQRFWAHDSAIGKHVWFDPKKPMEIVGVVGSVKQYGLDIDGKIVMYMAHAQSPASRMYMVARTSSDPAAMAAAMAREVHAVDRDVPIYEVRSMPERLSDSLARQRFSTTMLTAFALFALVLAMVGVYGVMSYLVTQGTHDVGVRIALGAQRGNIVGLVVRRGMQLAGIGICAGVLGAVSLTRVMSSLLFGTTATDPLTFSSVTLILLLIALLATYIPARRATRVDPMVALREE
jgi:predicted permease